MAGLPSRTLVPALAALLLVLSAPPTANGAQPSDGPTPQLTCDQQSLPETGAQGRVPKAEVDNGRAAKGYRCNTAQVGTFGDSGGFRVERYVDASGHECASSPDGTVFYVSSAGGHTLAAVDVTNPRVPVTIWATADYAPHGMSVSADGNRLYIADTALPGLIILDVSGINGHQVNPKVPVVSKLSWPLVSIPQNAIPFSEKGHPYLAEVDEYTNTTTHPNQSSVQNGGYDPNASVGAARIIDIQNDSSPFVISNLRLAVNQTSARSGDQQNDYGAKSGVQGYAAHYCNVPAAVDPTYVACSFILSGLRVFNIQDLMHPYEMAYFNAPSTPPSPAYVGINGGNFAMSAPTFDTSRNEVWYSDGFWGFYVVKLTPGAFSAARPHPAPTG